MERITESEEKNRDRDLDDLDFGDLDPADLGFTDPCFGDPGETPAAGGEKKEPESGTDSGNEAASLSSLLPTGSAYALQVFTADGDQAYFLAACLPLRLRGAGRSPTL